MMVSTGVAEMNFLNDKNGFEVCNYSDGDGRRNRRNAQ
jgi:hypothetical protein